MDFLYILLAIVILLVMIVIHEFGHYTAGKLLKFKINEFAVGFGPKIFSKKKKNGEVFSLRAFPLGGFCAFEGEDELEEKRKARRAAFAEIDSSAPAEPDEHGLIPFDKQPPYKRIIVLLAGAVFNLVSAVIFSFIFIAVAGYSVPKVELVYATTNQPIFAQGDVIQAVNGEEITIMTDLASIMGDISTNEVVELTVMRDGQLQTLRVTKQEYVIVQVQKGHKNSDLLKEGDIVLAVNGQVIDIGNRWEDVKKQLLTEGNTFLIARANEQERRIDTLDVKLSKAQFDSFFAENTLEIEANGLGVYTSSQRESGGVLYGLRFCLQFTGKMSWMMLDFFGDLITGKIPLKGNLNGPITTISIIAEESQKNWLSILIFLPMIAANLGLFNLFPIPAMDGSKIVFTTIEWIRKKPINRNVEAWIHFGGLVFLLGLVIVVELLNFIG